MTRYQVLRHVGCDPISAGFIAFLNWLRGVPPDIVRFGTVEIELPAAGVMGTSNDQGENRG